MPGDPFSEMMAGGGNTVTSTPTALTGPITGAPIRVSPIGVNFGSILQPFTDAPENGGFGLQTSSRYVADLAEPSTTPGSYFSSDDKNLRQNIAWLGIGLAVAGVVLFAWRVLQ